MIIKHCHTLFSSSKTFFLIFIFFLFKLRKTHFLKYGSNPSTFGNCSSLRKLSNASICDKFCHVSTFIPLEERQSTRIFTSLNPMCFLDWLRSVIVFNIPNIYDNKSNNEYWLFINSCSLFSVVFLLLCSPDPCDWCVIGRLNICSSLIGQY